MADQKPIRQTIEDTDSTVHSLWDEIGGEGGLSEAIDATKATTEQIAGRLNALIRRWKVFEIIIRKVIQLEISKQTKPLQEKLDEFIDSDVKKVYLVPKIPWFLRIFFKYEYERKPSK